MHRTHACLLQFYLSSWSCPATLSEAACVLCMSSASLKWSQCIECKSGILNSINICWKECCFWHIAYLWLPFINTFFHPSVLYCIARTNQKRFQCERPGKMNVMLFLLMFATLLARLTFTLGCKHNF